MKEFPGLRAKAYSYLKGNNNKDKQPKSTKKCIIKKTLNFKIIKLFRSSSNREKSKLFKRKEN